MTRRSLARITLAVTLVLAPFVACDVYDESLLGAPADASTSSSGTLPSGRGVGYWSGNNDNGCPSVKRPTLADKPRTSSPGDVGPIVVGLRQIDLGSTNPLDGGPADNAWKSLGFDIDGLCTGASKTCGKSDEPACAPLQGQLPIDGEYCRDNSFGNLATTLTYASSLTSQFGFGSLDCALCSGALNFLVRVQGYNGQADDDAIEVDFFPAVGLETPLPVDCSARFSDSSCFRPFMPWNIDRKVVTGASPGSSPSTLRSSAAFVRDGTVVIFLPDAFPIYFPGDDTIIRAFPITVHQGFITGKLAKQPDDTWRVDDGMIGGSTLLTEVLSSLEQIGLCKGDTNYTVAEGVIQNVADLLGSGTIDKNAPCDAVSVGIGFVAQQATLGKAVEAPVRDYCGAGRADAGKDSGPGDGG